MLPSAILSFVALAASAFAQTPSVVAHDSLNPIADTLGPDGAIIRKFQPLLHIAHGCQPYTAVRGNAVSGGLQDTGTVTGGCRDTSKGQTYARAGWQGGRFGIMYAWYWPKDQPADGDLVGGHRHDWESIVVWLSARDINASIVGGSASGHGQYKLVSNPQRRGTNLQVEYFVSFPRNHELQFSGTAGRTYWIYDWAAMDAPTQNSLNVHRFGAANCPFNNNNFGGNMARAALP